MTIINCSYYLSLTIQRYKLRVNRRHCCHFECVSCLVSTQNVSQRFHFQFFPDVTLGRGGTEVHVTSRHCCEAGIPDARLVVDTNLKFAFPSPGQHSQYQEKKGEDKEHAGGNSNNNHFVVVPAPCGRRYWNLSGFCFGCHICSATFGWRITKGNCYMHGLTDMLSLTMRYSFATPAPTVTTLPSPRCYHKSL